MESGTGSELPAERAIGYFDALKIVALPLGSVVGVLGLVFYFAAGAWVKGIVQDEITALELGSSTASTTLTQHASKLEQHDKDIEDNEEEIDEVDDKFTQFVRDVIAKL